VGSLLLRAAEARLRAADSRSVELETAVDNLSALSFYKRHGYSVIKTRPRYYSNGVDALVLEKDLV
jgi:ribosomal-protein-alanine N-acetyltransferase